MKFIVFYLVDDIDLKKSIFAGELQFKKIAERKSKYIDSDIDSSTGIKRNNFLPNICWTVLPTELRSHTLAAKQTLT